MGVAGNVEASCARLQLKYFPSTRLQAELFVQVHTSQLASLTHEGPDEPSARPACERDSVSWKTPESGRRHANGCRRTFGLTRAGIGNGRAVRT